MTAFDEKYEKYTSYLFLFMMIACLLPMCVLGFYNHPLGDDFYYGSAATMIWRETGNIFQTVSSALAETIKQYNIWQGTYSAMFFMHLTPFVFGDFFYKIYPTVLLICFTGSIFYLMYILICYTQKATKKSWIAVSSLLVLVMTQQVPLCGETFYWYNGSMYYTGFFACTCFFWGMLIKNLTEQKKVYTLLLAVIAFFIAGGNYVSLLPSAILLFLLLICYAYQVFIKKEKKRKQLISLCIIAIFLFGGFLISVVAPGNAIRQSTSLKSSPLKTIFKSIYLNTRYCLYWNGIWSFLFFIFVTPIFVQIIKKSDWKFQHPVIISALIFGIYCSTSCPTLYAQSNGGAARVFCLVYYILILAEAMIYFYILGAMYRWLECKKREQNFRLISLIQTGLGVLFISTFLFRSWDECYIKPHAITAVQAIYNGDAAYYEKQYQNRLSILEDADVQNVVFSAYDVPEALVHFLYVGDISPNATDDVNQKMAELYGKNSIRVEY